MVHRFRPPDMQTFGGRRGQTDAGNNGAQPYRPPPPSGPGGFVRDTGFGRPSGRCVSPSFAHFCLMGGCSKCSTHESKGPAISILVKYH